MLIIKNQEYFDQVKAEIKGTHLEAKFQAALDRLTQIFGSKDKPESVRHNLAKDFAKWSFSWWIEKQSSDGTWRFVMNGGLIYSGPSQRLDGGAPAYVVSMDDQEEGWSLHS